MIREYTPEEFEALKKATECLREAGLNATDLIAGETLRQWYLATKASSTMERCLRQMVLTIMADALSRKGNQMFLPEYLIEEALRS